MSFSPGLQLEPGKHYSQNVSKAFHITHAAIGREGSSPIVDWLVAVRAIVNDSDYILCYLGCAKGTVMLQQPLSLEVAEGEEVVLYTQPVNDNCKDRYFVHLTGYYEDDLYEPTESEIMDAAFDNELDESYEVPEIENVTVSGESIVCSLSSLLITTDCLVGLDIAPYVFVLHCSCATHRVIHI